MNLNKLKQNKKKLFASSGSLVAACLHVCHAGIYDGDTDL